MSHSYEGVATLGAPPARRAKQALGKHVVWLWAVPRSMSTVIAKAFTQAPNTTVVHEPFTDAYYFGARRRSGRYGRASDVAALIEPDDYCALERFPDGTTFVKELAFQALPFVSDETLRSCTHSFLIRHPYKVLGSLLPLKPDFSEEEFGFTSLEHLLLLADRASRKPLAILDGERLRHNPEQVMRRYCELVDIPFDAGMLSWTPGPVRPWKDHEQESQKKWHRTLEGSRGFLAAPEHVPMPQLQGQLSQMQCDYVERALRIYQRIHASFTVL